MKVRVNKKWWQFWLPCCLELDDEFVHFHKKDIKSDYTLSVDLDKSIRRDGSYSGIAEELAIEADDSEPWYQEESEGNVVTAEPPIVSASRGNARLAERKERLNGKV